MLEDCYVGEMACPKCGKKLDSAIGLCHRDKPKPGDFTLCIGCLALLRFTVLGLAATTESDLEALDPQQRRDIAQVVQLVEKTKQEKHHGSDTP